MTSASIAEELVNRSTGSPEPRYFGAGVISEGDDPKTTLDALCLACCGRFLDTAGRLSFSIAHNDLAEMASDEGLLTDDVVGPFTWDPDPALEQAPNVARGRFVDPSPASLYQLIDYPEVRFPSPDGIDRILPLDLGVVESASHAQRVVKQVLQRKQYQRSFTAPFDERAWIWPVGKIVPFTFAPLGFVRRPFRVVEQEVGQGGACNMVLREESEAIYAWDADDVAPVQAVAAIIYDPAKAPLIQAIADATSNAALRIIAASTEYPATSDDNSITVPTAFTATLSDGRTNVTLPVGSVTGLPASTTYMLFYDQSAAAYIAPVAPALTEAGDPDNIFIGRVSTLNELGEPPPQDTPPPGWGGYYSGNPIP
jgi:stage V sporulation protein SpoVS